jgi:hypothetical protein
VRGVSGHAITPITCEGANGVSVDFVRQNDILAEAVIATDPYT